MPERDALSGIHPYPLPTRGINLHKNVFNMLPDESLRTQNLLYDSGLVKRGGTLLYDSTEVVSSKQILGLHKYYLADGSTKYTVVACGTKIAYGTGSGWTNMTIGGGGAHAQTTGLQTDFCTWGAKDAIYGWNGTDEMFKFDTQEATATDLTQLTLADGVPSWALPYQDRLLTIIGGVLTWSASYDDTEGNWETDANCGVRPDTKLYGMIRHAVNDTVAGSHVKVLLAGANGMYLFWGDDLRPPYTQGDYTTFQIPISVGCDAPRTMVSTPKGTMWLGRDRQVYLLPYDSPIPVEVGTNIKSLRSDEEGIESIPAAYLSKACAAYHDGFYKLAIPRSGDTTNTTQLWLDTKRLQRDDEGNVGPWYGPMTGMDISCMVAENGFGDTGDLLGGEHQAYGYVYKLDQNGTYGDIDPTNASTKSIATSWKTYHNPLGNADFMKSLEHVNTSVKDTAEDMNIDFYDISGKVRGTETKTLGANATYWDEDYWNDFYWSGDVPIDIDVPVDPPVKVRRLSMEVSHTSQSSDFQIYGLQAKALEEELAFEE